MTDTGMYVVFVIPPGAGEIMFEPEYEVAKHFQVGDTVVLTCEVGSRVAVEGVEFIVGRREWNGSELKIYLSDHG